MARTLTDTAESMGEIKQGGHTGEAPRIGVCVGGERRGFGALKWAIRKDLIPPNGHVYFLHVKPPLRWIPNAMGGKLPVDHVNPDIVKRFQEERFLETQKLFNDYKNLCSSKKITYEVCYSENDSIQEELVKQICKLRITKLFLEKASHKSFLRVLGAQSSISAYVAENATFCKVIVIRNNKLHSISEGRASEPDSPVSVSSDKSSKLTRSETTSSVDEYTTTKSILKEEHMKSELCNSYPTVVQSTYTDISRKPSERLRSDNDNSAETQSLVMISGSGSPFPKRSTESATATLFSREPLKVGHMWNSSMDAKHAFVGLNSTSINDHLGQTSSSNMSLKDMACKFNQPAQAASDFVDASTSGCFPPYDSDVHSRLSLETDSLTESSMLEVLSSQKLLHEMENFQEDSKPVLGSTQASPTLEFDLLQCQLTEAKQSTLQWVQKEAEHRAKNFEVAEKIVKTAQKKITVIEMQRDTALNDAKMASYRALYHQRENEKLAAEIQAALQEKDSLQKRFEEEIRRHTATKNDLEKARGMADDFAKKAEIYEHEYRTERCRSEQLTLEFKKQNKELERVCHLKKKAEGGDSREANVTEFTKLSSTREQDTYVEFSFKEIQAATNNFAEKNKLGQGGYGPVYKGELKFLSVAIKVLAREGTRGRAEFKKEVDILSCLHHPHIVMLIGACSEKGCIVYEYMSNGSLEDRLNCRDNSPPLPWFIRLQVCLEVAIGLLFLHSRPQPIVHRDLKPGNILLDDTFHSKISDVGLAKLVPNQSICSGTIYKETEIVGTLPYLDPEYQRTGFISRESDVYSLGIVMLQLLTGKLPLGLAVMVEEAVENGQLDKVLDKSAGEWPLKEASALACLSLQCVEPRRKHRPPLESHILPVLKSMQKIAGTMQSSCNGG
ncbi:hypothetical protein KP509_12G007600 [Ceratopteris richardii]|uniref:RING-type E3 ubiquitin transferase n=2 Tax=Ceratopteris richardii TaxID=49495 RepID=A0A8T2TKQ4_CERRI|nr:hypothetical protein KP509_12G007600 [Ceratopteris richardii]